MKLPRSRSVTTRYRRMEEMIDEQTLLREPSVTD